MTHTTTDDRAQSINLPYLDLSHLDAAALTFAALDQRWKLLDRLLEEHGESRARIPAAWCDNPLQAWCWLVLTLNQLDIDPEVHRPLSDWGIDISFTSTELRQWVWFLA